MPLKCGHVEAVLESKGFVHREGNRSITYCTDRGVVIRVRTLSVHMLLARISLTEFAVVL